MARERTPEAPALPQSERAVDDSRLDSTLSELERLVGRALTKEVSPGGDELGELTARLTLAQWGLRRHDEFARQWPRQAAMLAAAAASAAYLVYRAFWTMNLAGPGAAVFSAVLLAAEFYAVMSLWLYFYQVWRLVEPPLRAPTPGRSVDVFVATYNEDVELLRGTLRACVEMDYPHATYVLDDGARPEVKKLAEGLGVRYLSRKERTHAKAGNLNNAMRHTSGEFVVVLDADHVPYRHYLSRLIGYFDDPRLGFVQTPHTTYNLNNFLGRWKRSGRAYWEDVRIFFEAVQLGKNRHGVACFCGSAAIMRRKALEDAGLFATETITEDMHTGMRINAAGWKSIAVSEEMVVGLAPGDIETFAGQRLRWGEGNLSILAYDNPLTMKGLTLAGRINHLASILCWTMGPTRLLLYLTPLVMLLTGIPPVADMRIAYFVAAGLYLFSVLAAVKIASNRCGQLLGIELAMMASFGMNIRAMWRAAFRRRRQKFVVTKKRGVAGTSIYRRLWPQAAIVAAGVVAVSWAAARIAYGISADYLGLSIGGGLAAYHGWLALTILYRASRGQRSDGPWRHPACLAADYAFNGEVQAAVSLEFNENTCRLLAWKELEPGSSVRITLHSPVGDAAGRGKVIYSMPLGKGAHFAYLNHIVFGGDDAGEREAESDALRGLAMRYVVPVVTLAHRFHRRRPSLEMLSGEGELPLPLTIDANLPNMGVHKTVGYLLDGHGFFATLDNLCPVGSAAEITLDTPLGRIVAAAEAEEVEAVRVGDALVYQHKFRWRDNRPLRRLLGKKRGWAKALHRADSRLRNNRPSLVRIAAWQLAACLLAAATVFVFERVNHDDIVLAAAAGKSPQKEMQEIVREIFQRRGDITQEPTERLLRIYNAAAAGGDYLLAAETAKELSDRYAKRRGSWMLTSARNLVRSGDQRAADAAFDEIIAQRLEREFAPDDRADVYVEAARAALAAGGSDKAVERFFTAGNFRAVDQALAEELLGVLIAEGKVEPALKILSQMEQNDDVLRQIVDVCEIAGRPREAMPALLELERRRPGDVSVTIRLAELSAMSRDFAAASAYYEKALKAEPGNIKAKDKFAEAKIMLARELAAAEKLDEAITLFEESFRLHAPHEILQREYAGLLAQDGRFDEAAAVLERLDDADSQLELAAILEMKGDFAAALAVLLQIENKWSGEVEREKFERAIVRLLLAEKQFDAAAERLIDLMHKYPQNERLRREFIEAAAAADPDNDKIRRAAAEVFAQYRDANYEGLDAGGFLRLGDALRRFELFDAARAELQTGVDRYPQSRRLRLRLAQTLDSLGRYDDAEKHFRILLDSRSTVRK